MKKKSKKPKMKTEEKKTQYKGRERKNHSADTIHMCKRSKIES